MFLRDSEGGGARFAALPESVSGYGGRGINGSAYSSGHGHLFRDADGGDWWMIFQSAGRQRRIALNPTTRPNQPDGDGPCLQ